ncbi:MAG: glycoside hydrolase domain-containing protein [Chitinophagaceae bacterium]
MKIYYFILLPLFFPLINFCQELPYTIPEKSWDADSLGNHRAVIHFSGDGKIAFVKIPWRRRDVNPEKKRIIVQDGQTGLKILNVKTLSISRETGEIYFEPRSGTGTYYIYYLPYKNEGRSNYPRGVYLTTEQTASQEWLSSIPSNAPIAATHELQSIDAFNSFYPMEVIATGYETEAIIKKNAGSSFLVFPEDRLHSIKMKNDLPKRWIEKGNQGKLLAEADKGEYFAYQLGIYALKELTNVQIKFTDLVSTEGKIIAATNSSCINTDGTSYDGKKMKIEVSVLPNTVQAMWCGIQVPAAATSGTYKGKVIVTCKQGESKTIFIELAITNKTAINGGIEEPWKMTRLKWLNSTLEQENTVIAPYTPLQESNSVIQFLGRKLFLEKNGLPQKIETFFTEEMTSMTTSPKEVLAAPIRFEIETPDGLLTLKPISFSYISKKPGTIKWIAVSVADKVKLEVTGSLEFDGFVSYQVKLSAAESFAVNDIRMIIPFTKDAAEYMMGLGQKGGTRPSNFHWKWDVAAKNQDGGWIGSINAGLQFSLRDEKYNRPLNTNFYLQKPLLLPTSWGNNGRGGINIKEESTTVSVVNYSGPRNLKKGESLFYNFNLLITPFHTINTDFQWANRFYHSYKAPDTVKAAGANVINIHHANEINPWINYPFIEFKKMKAYIDEAHSKGLKVKIYNTVREVSNKAYELPALRSLGHEIYSPGKGGGFSWLQEHVADDYIAAWFVPELKDAAIINSGMNRWHNYYVEGMNWLVQNVGIDGIYLDDVAFDRITMKRIKRALTQDGHPGILDLHSANQFNKNDGFNNSANLYLEHFPYLNRLWFGEYFDYEKNEPDFFLTEISGIPFGLMGEMLQDGGNAWRGMIYGMTSRMPWSVEADPRSLWKIWDEFGMQGTSMIGYWSSSCPVKTSDPKVLATVYQKKGKAMIAIANWEPADTVISLEIDWKKLGMDPTTATIKAPAIKNFQEARVFKWNDTITVSKNKGWLLIIKE